MARVVAVGGEGGERVVWGGGLGGAFEELGRLELASELSLPGGLSSAAVRCLLTNAEILVLPSYDRRRQHGIRNIAKHYSWKR
jgi:hypothetical protein